MKDPFDLRNLARVRRARVARFVIRWWRALRG